MIKLLIKKISLSLTFLLAVLISASSFSAPQWILEKDEDGIQVYVRTPEGKELKEFKGVVNINTSLDSLMALMDDTKACTEWILNCTQPKLLKSINFRERFTYQVSNLPWPLTDRDVIIHVLLNQDPLTKVITLNIEAKPNFIPIDEDFVRIETSIGQYIFKPLGDGNVEVVWIQYNDPAGKLSTSLINALVVDMPFKSLEKMRELVQQSKYQKAKLVYGEDGIAQSFEQKYW
jgi:hypothetical protein